MKKIDLSGSWNSYFNEQETIPINIPGDIYSVLINTKKNIRLNISDIKLTISYLRTTYD